MNDFSRRLLVLLGATLFLQTVHAEVAETAAIRFLSQAEAEDAILDDSAEPYFERLEPLEMKAKVGHALKSTSLEDQREECRALYRDAVEEFTPKEKAALTWYVEQIQPVLQRDYPLFAKTPWSFMKVSPFLEGGLPHTRGEQIILSPLLLRTMIQMDSSERKESLSEFGEMLVHEQMHVFQRSHPAMFVELYRDFWEFEHIQVIEPDPWLKKHQLTNPDAVECNWIFPLRKGGTTRWIWPLVIFKDTSGIPKMPQDFRRVAIELEKTEDGFTIEKNEAGDPVVTDLLSIPDYAKNFPGTTDIYHPNEASADLFALIFVYDAWVSKSSITDGERNQWEKKYGELREWFRAHLQNDP